ncbi:single-stranded DNA-binding protein [Enterococcus cecorum]|uniref:single-stranded DNA-binding protein n=1 Tax=Enterococcus cecorum TaxID=44008 RepID=UPI0032C413F4
MNNVSLIGRLTKDPDLRYTSSGMAVATFSLAVQRSFRNKDGEYEADFINCVCWNKSGETLANHVKKGQRIGVTGRIQTRNYENEQGNRVYVTEVVVEGFTFLEKKDENQNSNQGSFGAKQGGFNQGPTITNDDLPF